MTKCYSVLWNAVYFSSNVIYVVRPPSWLAIVYYLNVRIIFVQEYKTQKRLNPEMGKPCLEENDNVEKAKKKMPNASKHCVYRSRQEPASIMLESARQDVRTQSHRVHFT